MVLVPVLPERNRAKAADLHAPDDRLGETVGLAQAIDLDVRDAQVVSLATVRPGALFGSGKIEEIETSVAVHEIGIVIVDHALTPIQQRNLEVAWKTKVLDRTGLILEIFGRRAQTREGRLQVELAHLTYQRGRLVRSWTHLERQRGGFGFLGGPGESQIETDRRIINDRIDKIKRELETVVRTRSLHRAGRRKVPYPVVALVGYTNAGKSTLFNVLTGAGVHAEDQVFATLDPTMREIRLSSGRRIILSDTVGFISNLPTTLVAAFRATLEEVINADLVLHVRDIAHEETEAQKADVTAVLEELGIDPHAPDFAMIEVLNKVDALDRDDLERLAYAAERADTATVLVSAIEGDGIQTLLSSIDEALGAGDIEMDLTVRPEDGRLTHWIYENADVLSSEADTSGNVHYRLRVSGEKRGQLEARLASGN
ncbi:MAG: GTPase HflX [Pseudomonadota bacterium]